MKVSRYTAAESDWWDDFVQNHSRNGNIFHERKFLAYHGDRFEDCSVMVLDEKNDDILAVIPAALVREESGLGVVSHPGSTYGGIVFRRDLKTGGLKDVIDTSIHYYHENYGAGYFKVTLQEEFHTGASFSDLVYLLWHRGFCLHVKEIGAFKDLKERNFEGYRNTTKQYIRSKKDDRLGIMHGAAVDPEGIRDCYRLLEGNLKNRFGKQPTHSLAEMMKLKELLGDRITFFYSKYQGNTAATVICFELNKEVVHDFYIAQNYEYASFNPLIGLFNYIFEYYRSLGYEIFNFGISSRGKWIKWGILGFKEQFGARILTRDTWILKDLSGEWPYDGEPGERQ